MVNKSKKIGLALGGGGARGLAHIGVLKILARENIKIDMIAGSSMGAMLGAYYALGFDLNKLEKEVIDFNKSKAIKSFVDLGKPKYSILKGKKISNYINKLLGSSKFSDTKIPLSIVTTDLANGREVVVSEGDISQAVQASISVPGIFPPVVINNKYLVDGGVVNPTPVALVEKIGADIIIGVDLIAKREVKLDNPNLVTVLMQSYEIIRNQAIEYNLAKLKNKNIVLIKPEMRGTIDSFKFYDISKFIDSGEQAAKREINKIKKLINR